VFTGFASGLPRFILITLVPAWLSSEQVDLKSIGFFALIQLPYTWKFVWSPLLDRYALTRLGRRNSWMLIAQDSLLVSIPAFGVLQPTADLWAFACLAVAISLFSATVDIAIDAFRREILSDAELGLGNAGHVNACRIAGLVPGSLSLVLADHLSRAKAYVITALSLAALPRTVISATTGWMVEQLGWYRFFWLCFTLALPGMLLLARIAPWHGPGGGDNLELARK